MRSTIIIGILFFSLVSHGQTHPNLSSPSKAISTHLYYLQDETYNDSLARLPFLSTGIDTEEALIYARKLKQVLDGSGIYIDISTIPSDQNYFDSTRLKQEYIQTDKYPNIILRKVGGNWIYPSSSLIAIDEAHSQLFRFGTDKLVNLLPKLGDRKVMGLYLYQYISILILVFLAVLIQRVFSLLFNKLFLRLIKKAGYEQLTDGFLIPIAKPSSVFVVLILLAVFVPVLQLPPTTIYYTTLIIKALIPLFATIIFYRLANILSLYLERVAKRTKSTLDDQLVPLIRKTLKAFVVAIGTLFVLDNLNIDIIPLLTGLSIGGLAFALAAQDTIKNFFGSLMIFIDKPFQIGDWITSGEIDGTVEEVGFRSSRIRTFRNSVMYVPNGKMADSMVDNHGLRSYRRFYTQISITYDTPPELIETFIDGLRRIVDNHPNTRKDYYNIYLNDMASHSLNIMFYIFFQTPDWPGELRARHEVLLEVIRLADKLGINFAFPTQTLHVENFPGQLSMSPTYASKDQMRKDLDEFFAD